MDRKIRNPGMRHLALRRLPRRQPPYMKSSPNNADRLKEKSEKNKAPGMLMTGFLVPYNGKCKDVQWEQPKQLLFKEVRHFSDTKIKCSAFCVRLKLG